MDSGGLRRRVRHEDVGGRKHEHLESTGFDDLNEPLLGREGQPGKRHSYDDEVDEDYEDDSKRGHAQIFWKQIFMGLLAQWVQFFEMLFSYASWPRSTFLYNFSKDAENGTLESEIFLTALQEERLQKLQSRIAVPFNGTCSDHQEALRELWNNAFPGRHLIDLVSDQWKDMGWQGKDPSTDFRGGGFISLENLIFFSREYPTTFQKLLNKEEGRRSEWEYPFAVAGINISFMLIQMLDLRSGRPKNVYGRTFLKFLEEDELAFDRLYCVAFQMMDAQWLAMRASYMEFNAVLKATQTQLEREHELDDVSSIKDLPGFTLLCQ